MRAKEWIVSICCVLLFLGCKSNSETVVNQKEKFYTYVENKSRLGLDVSMESEDYLSEQNGVLRVLFNKNRVGYETDTAIEDGDEVSFFFVAYVFDGSKDLNQMGCFYSNYSNVITDFEVDWPAGIKTATCGSDQLIEGVNRGLIGSREGDDVALFIISDLAYGAQAVGVLPKDTPVVYRLEIQNVNKK